MEHQFIFNEERNLLQANNKNCAFCKKNIVNNDRYNLIVALYRTNNVDNYLVFKNIQYHSLRFLLNRCKTCKKIHLSSMIEAFLLLFLPFAFAGIYFYKNNLPTYLIPLLIGAPIVIFIGTPFLGDYIALRKNVPNKWKVLMSADIVKPLEKMGFTVVKPH